MNSPYVSAVLVSDLLETSKPPIELLRDSAPNRYQGKENLQSTLFETFPAAPRSAIKNDASVCEELNFRSKSA